MGNKNTKHLFWFLMHQVCHRERVPQGERGDPVHQRDCFGHSWRPCNDKNKDGFTLIELLVGITIVGLISTVAIANFRQGQRSTELRLSAEELVAQIRQAQTMSISGQATKVCQDNTEQIPLGGYGVYFVKSELTSFKLFADCDNNHAHDDDEDLANGAVSLPAYVEVSELSNGDNGDLTIVFEPPKGKVYIHSLPSGTAKIVLKHKVTQDIKAVLVDAISGRIEIE